jgi:hypothetical protein
MSAAEFRDGTSKDMSALLLEMLKLSVDSRFGKLIEAISLWSAIIIEPTSLSQIVENERRLLPSRTRLPPI